MDVTKSRSSSVLKGPNLAATRVLFKRFGCIASRLKNHTFTAIRKAAVACLFSVILSCSWRCNANSKSFADLAEPLPDGLYLIERINFNPSRHFANETEAKTWSEAVKKNPDLIKPTDDFFQLYLSGNDFIIRQLRLAADGQYQSNSNFLVAVSGKTGWAFEEAANRVTVITNLDDPSDGGPVAGLLMTGDAYRKSLKHLGLSAMDLSSIKETGTNQFTGTGKNGEPIYGTVQYADQLQITNIVCDLGGGEKPYELNFGILRAGPLKQLSEVVISRRQSAGMPWRPMVQYTVKQALPLPEAFEVSAILKQFKNLGTLVVSYDAMNKTTVIQETNGATHVLARADLAYNTEIGSNPRRLVIIVLGALTIVGVIIIFRALKHSS